MHVKPSYDLVQLEVPDEELVGLSDERQMQVHVGFREQGFAFVLRVYLVVD